MKKPCMSWSIRGPWFFWIMKNQEAKTCQWGYLLGVMMPGSFLCGCVGRVVGSSTPTSAAGGQKLKHRVGMLGQHPLLKKKSQIDFYLIYLAATNVLTELLNDWWSNLCGMAGLGSGQRCGSGRMRQYKTPDILESIRVQRRRARSTLYWRVFVKTLLGIKWYNTTDQNLRRVSWKLGSRLLFVSITF